jgi:hypothetical protein
MRRDLPAKLTSIEASDGFEHGFELKRQRASSVRFIFFLIEETSDDFILVHFKTSEFLV